MSRHVRAALSVCLAAAAAAACANERKTTSSSAGEATSSPTSSGSSYAAADSALHREMSDSAQWPSYGRDYTNQRYSPLAQITPANVGRLALAWRYHTGVPHALEVSPVVVDSTMYVTTAADHVIALDAKTGARKWEYVPSLTMTVHCCGAVNRGVAVYDGKVYIGQLDAKLIALDANDGHVVWATQVGNPNEGYSLTGPPVAVDGMIITGISGAEYGIRGYVTAYDAKTGQERWRFYTIPSPEEGGWWGKWSETGPFGTPLHRDIAQEKRDSAKYADAWKAGGGSMWQAVAVDQQLGLVIFSTGNPAPDLNGMGRPGDNLYTTSIVALDLTTGKLKWYFQEVPHNEWDLDATSPVMLVDVTDQNGKTVKAVAEAGKTGWVYIVDRATGKPIRRSDNYVPIDNMFSPPTADGTRMLPGANGGSEWSPAAYSPLTGYMYVLGLHQPMYYKVFGEKRQPPAFWLGGAFFATGEPQYGLFSAVDLNTGKIAWQAKVKDPMIGGAVATAGGVVFTGTKDKHVLAYDAATGQQLWSFVADGGVNAPPISYAIGGRQYIAVAAGGNYQIDAPRSDEILVFSLPSSVTTHQASSAPTDTARRGGQ